MQTLKPHEEKAVEFASQCAGEYLDELGKTDLATLTAEEWQQLNRLICVNFWAKRIELDPCPF